MMRSLAFAALLGSSTALAQTPAAPAAPVALGRTSYPVRDKIEITWIGHAAFLLKTAAGTIIAIDPFIKGNPAAPKDLKLPEKIDAILVTHGHSDHVGDARELADKHGAIVIGSYELTSLIGAKNNGGGNAGGTVAVKDDVKVHMVEAVHSSGFGADPAKAQYGGSPLGFVVEVKGGPRVYHAGDTDAFASMSLIGSRYKPTIGLLPIGGHFTMDPDGAAVAAKLLGLRTVVPMHFATFPPLVGTPAQLKDALNKAKLPVLVVEMKPGETKAL